MAETYKNAGTRTRTRNPTPKEAARKKQKEPSRH